MTGRIIKLISDDYTVLGDDGQTYVCKSRGKFRIQNISPVVGDFVKIDSKQLYILDVLPRMNCLVRPSVANIDYIVIVTSVEDPDFSTNLLDKLLTIMEFYGVNPIICFTKLDLLEDLSEIQVYIDYYKKIGYSVYLNSELSLIRSIFKDQVIAFTGQSGAGKSTLLNRLNPDLRLQTNEISKALGRGKHTTRHVELIAMEGGWVADTPGFSSIDFIGMSCSDIRDCFVEFQEHRDECKYRDCMHDKEDHCAIKQLVLEKKILKSRYDNYLKFIKR